jgi:hypothetical protein
MVNRRSMNGNPRKHNARELGLMVENTERIFPISNLQSIYARMIIPMIGSSFFQFIGVQQGYRLLFLCKLYFSNQVNRIR